MLSITGEAKYADLLERSLYNGFLSGISLDGQRYFYVNPLSSPGGIERPEWYGCACCPPNVMRQIALLGHYIATTNQDGIQIQQYIASEIEFDLQGGHSAKIQIETVYPWEGKVKLIIQETDGDPWELALRIPHWCEEASVQLGDDSLDVSEKVGDYARYKRSWKVGDVVYLNLNMQPRFLEPNPRIDATRGSLAVALGPLVYCFEGIDQPAETNLADLRIDSSKFPEAIWQEDLLNGIMKVHVQGALADMSGWQDVLYRSLKADNLPYQELELIAIPYYAWANRTLGTMRVWIPRL